MSRQIQHVYTPSKSRILSFILIFTRIEVKHEKLEHMQQLRELNIEPMTNDMT